MVIGIDASRAFVVERTGTEEYSYQLITHMLSLPEVRKHKFVLFTRPGAIIADKIRACKNIKICEIKYRYLWTQAGLAIATWQNELDVLWIPAHTLPILRNPQLKTVVTIHGMEYKWLPEYKNWLQRWYLPLSTYYAARYANKLIAVSENTKSDLLKEINISSNKVKVIHEGIALSSSPVAQYPSGKILEKYGLQEKKYILFIGSLQPRKNLPALVEAFKIFSQSNQGYKLVISGGKGWMSEAISQAVVRCGLEDRVVFTGRISEEVKGTLLSQAAIYVQPSITEGFGLPVLEAMQMGVPVVVSSGGALPEVVGSSGLVVKLGEDFARSLANVLTTIIHDKAKTAKMVSNGYKRVSELTWVKAAKETLDYLTKS